MTNLLLMTAFIFVFTSLGGYLVYKYPAKDFMFGTGIAMLTVAFLAVLLIVLAFLDY